MRGQQHVADDFLLRDATRLRGVGNLLFDQRRQHVAGAHRVDGDAGLGHFQRHRLGEAGHAVLGGDIGRLVLAGHQRMRRRHVDDAAEALALHRRQRQPRGVEGGREVDREDRVPPVDREVVDRRHMLDAGVVDQQVDGAELRQRLAHHVLDGLGPAHVGAVVAHLHVVLLGEFGAQRFDLALVAEAVEDDVGALGRQRAGDAEADARGRAGDEGGLADEHGESS